MYFLYRGQQTFKLCDPTLDSAHLQVNHSGGDSTVDRPFKDKPGTFQGFTGFWPVDTASFEKAFQTVKLWKHLTQYPQCNFLIVKISFMISPGLFFKLWKNVIPVSSKCTVNVQLVPVFVLESTCNIDMQVLTLHWDMWSVHATSSADLFNQRQPVKPSNAWVHREIDLHMKYPHC